MRIFCMGRTPDGAPFLPVQVTTDSSPDRPDLARRMESGTTFLMNLKASLAVVFISVAPCFTSGAKAMSIHDFGRMDTDDEASFVTFLVVGSANMFKAHGQPDQARKVIAFFKVTGKDGGTYRFADKLQEVDALNRRNVINPNNRAPEYQVEDAMAETLKDEGLIVPATYLLTISKSFQPSGLPRARTPGQE